MSAPKAMNVNPLPAKAHVVIVNKLPLVKVPGQPNVNAPSHGFATMQDNVRTRTEPSPTRRIRWHTGRGLQHVSPSTMHAATVESAEPIGADACDERGTDETCANFPFTSFAPECFMGDQDAARRRHRSRAYSTCPSETPASHIGDSIDRALIRPTPPHIADASTSTAAIFIRCNRQPTPCQIGTSRASSSCLRTESLRRPP